MQYSHQTIGVFWTPVSLIWLSHRSPRPGPCSSDYPSPMTTMTSDERPESSVMSFIHSEVQFSCTQWCPSYILKFSSAVLSDVLLTFWSPVQLSSVMSSLYSGVQFSCTQWCSPYILVSSSAVLSDVLLTFWCPVQLYSVMSFLHSEVQFSCTQWCPLYILKSSSAALSDVLLTFWSPVQLFSVMSNYVLSL
jgi:hypothetical protein